MRGRGGSAYLLMVVLAAGCTTRTAAPEPAASTSPAESSQAGQVRVSFNGAPTLAVEVASTPEQRALGLMHRAEVPVGTGMLFLFPGATTGGFWMKNTLVPLSIAYVNGDRVVSTAEMAPCPPAATQCPTYEAAGPYTSAVEARAGFFPSHGVRPGTRLFVSGTIPTPQ